MNANMIELEHDGGITTLRFNRPSANALDLELLGEIDEALAEIESRNETRALILTGAGNCFSAGLDLKVVPSYTAAEQRALVTVLNRMVGRLYGLRLPTIAAVNGHAIAGGMIIVLACDYRIGADADYKMGLTEARVGVAFPVAPMAVVQAELSAPAARVAVLLARNTGPREAMQRGALDELQPAALLLPRAKEMAEEMAALPRVAYAKIKRHLRAAALAKIEDALVNQTEPMLNAWLDDETAQASAAVLARREPQN
jgi:enoyl-CoA hydratase